MQGKLADMYTTLHASRAYVYAVGAGVRPRRRRRARTPPARSSTRPRRRRGWRGEAIQCLGGNGYINEYPAGRLLARRQALRDRRRHHEIRRMLIGRELFDETKCYARQHAKVHGRRSDRHRRRRAHADRAPSRATSRSRRRRASSAPSRSRPRSSGPASSPTTSTKSSWATCCRRGPGPGARAPGGAQGRPAASRPAARPSTRCAARR